MEDNLTESQGDYLETIYEIICEKQGVRVKDIAQKLNVKNSSVTSALRQLQKNGYINYVPYGIISLTEKGIAISEKLSKRHKTLKYFFEKILEIEEKSSDEIACKLEHVIPKEIFRKFALFVEFLHFSEKETSELKANFNKYCEDHCEDINTCKVSDEFLESI